MVDLILRRWPLKLLALALAFAIWLAIRGESRLVRDYSVPVVVALRSEAILEGSPSKTVTVRLRGPETLLQATTMYDLQMKVDLSDADYGQRNVQLSEQALEGVPPGVHVDLIEPSRLTFEIARRERRTVPVVPSFTGRPPKGHAFYQAEAIPDSLEVEGPASKLAATARLRTDPIHLEDRTAPFTVKVGAVPDSPVVRVLDPNPVEVRVQIDVAPIDRVYPDVPVVLAGRSFEASVKPAQVAVTLSGPPEVLDRVRSAQLRALADVSALQPDDAAHEVPVRVDFVDVDLEDLARVSVRSISREKVSVTMSARRIAS